VADAPYLAPFVLPIATRPAERQGAVDLYLPDAEKRRPAVVFVHGGPIPAELRPTPRDWPVYRGYGSAAAARGLVGVTVDHRLYDLADYPRAASEVAAAVELVRADERVDGDRVGLWFFSGGGLLLADWLRDPPSWLRCAAASYPLLAPLSDGAVDPRFHPTEAVASAGALPIVLTRVGREAPPIAETVEAFIAAARDCGARLEVIDVPHGQHGFDLSDHNEESRNAVECGLDAMVSALG
jgi:acetyl esterase/lipase